jgi:hypothetical protein
MQNSCNNTKRYGVLQNLLITDRTETRTETSFDTFQTKRLVSVISRNSETASLGVSVQCAKNSVKFLRNPIESLLRRLQGNHTKYRVSPEELYTQWVLFRAKIYKLKESLSLYT